MRNLRAYQVTAAATGQQLRRLRIKAYNLKHAEWVAKNIFPGHLLSVSSCETDQPDEDEPA